MTMNEMTEASMLELRINDLRAQLMEKEKEAVGYRELLAATAEAMERFDSEAAAKEALIQAIKREAEGLRLLVGENLRALGGEIRRLENEAKEMKEIIIKVTKSHESYCDGNGIESMVRGTGEAFGFANKKGWMEEAKEEK